MKTIIQAIGIYLIIVASAIGSLFVLFSFTMLLSIFVEEAKAQESIEDLIDIAEAEWLTENLKHESLSSYFKNKFIYNNELYTIEKNGIYSQKYTEIDDEGNRYLIKKCYRYIDGKMTEVPCTELTPRPTETPLQANTPTQTPTVTPTSTFTLPTMTPAPEPPDTVTGPYTEKDLDISYKNGFLDGMKYVLQLKWLFGE